MKATEKIRPFEYLLLKLDEWNKEITDSEENDLSVLKAIKLTFFVSAVGTNRFSSKTLLDDVFDNFVAMPYGHVESDVYNNIRSNMLLNLTIDNKSTVFNNKINIQDCDSLIKQKIDDSIKHLKSINKEFIRLSSFDLVNLSHKWYSWQKFYNQAQKSGLMSFNIPIQEIKNEEKIYQL